MLVFAWIPCYIIGHLFIELSQDMSTFIKCIVTFTLSTGCKG